LFKDKGIALYPVRFVLYPQHPDALQFFSSFQQECSFEKKPVWKCENEKKTRYLLPPPEFRELIHSLSGICRMRIFS